MRHMGAVLSCDLHVVCVFVCVSAGDHMCSSHFFCGLPTCPAQCARADKFVCMLPPRTCRLSEQLYFLTPVFHGVTISSKDLAAKLYHTLPPEFQHVSALLQLAPLRGSEPWTAKASAGWARFFAAVALHDLVHSMSVEEVRW